ncbi:hypothetical protein A4A49_30991 [Nicotiana attenuata]|uniref:Uncharacterized protein n=1 Tax=Nicotiana attenuata TaxID=49451 RepID=A0A314L5E2_NICAT|nr:hypothetical protein A4A49_30991 [Nicotiana attenuata]
MENFRSTTTAQLCPQQFKYITCRSDSSACFLFSSPVPLPMNPPTSDPNMPDNGRRLSAPEEVEEEEKRFLPWCRDLRPDFTFWP